MILSGQVMPGSGAYVTWELVEIDTGRSLAAERIPGAELMEMADGIVEHVMPVLEEQCGTKADKLVKPVSDFMTADPQAYRHLVAGLLAREEGRNSDELEHLEKAVKLDSTFAKAFYELSRYYSRESGKASLYAEKAWENRSRLGTKDLMLLEAWRHWVEYRLQKSFEVHRKLLEHWPDDRQVLESLTFQLFSQWYPTQALEIAKKGLDQYPESFDFRRTYWMCLTDNDMEQALEAVRAHVDLHIENSGARDDMGLLYLWMGLPDSAEAVFKDNLSSNPGYWWSQFGLAASKYFRGDVEGAITAYEELLQKDGGTDIYRLFLLNQQVNIYPGLSILYAESGRFKKAFATIERSREYTRDDPKRELRSVTSPKNTLLLGYGEAKEVLRWAREMRSSDMRIARWQALRFEGEALAAMDSVEAAYAIINELKEIEPQWGGFASYMALKIGACLAISEDRPAEALRILKESKRIHGVPHGSYFGLEWYGILASAYEASGQIEDAVGVHLEVLRVYGGHAVSHFELGKLYEQLERPADAVREYEIFLEMWKNADEGLPQFEYAKDRLHALESIH
jgi:tetratricopeptide (TPR) repeat protein